MLRYTADVWSAILGGADAIANYLILCTTKTQQFGDRIARNQLLILKTKVILIVNNPADWKLLHRKQQSISRESISFI
jgi:hypothetical protein